MTWKYFTGSNTEISPSRRWPDCPPWRRFLPREEVKETVDKQYWDDLKNLAKEDSRSRQRGQRFQIPKDENGDSKVVDAVNAAIHLRRPLLVKGLPGSGKTSLAYAIAYELQLGPVLTWPITTKANLTDAKYSYEALARLQDAQLDQYRRQPSQYRHKTGRYRHQLSHYGVREEMELGNYIKLGPVGTAFLPSLRPRVLLIDEIDKSDLNLPNDLLNLFEEGEFEIPELARRKRTRNRGIAAETEDTIDRVGTADNLTAPVVNGKVKCCEFPITIMTSNGERDFPPAFYRRCLRVTMPSPTQDSLLSIVQSHFATEGGTEWTDDEENDLKILIGQFLDRNAKSDRSTDQLMNAIYLMTREESPDEAEMERLKWLLFKRLSEAD